MAASNPQSVGWSAIIGGVIGVIGFICLILLFVVGEPFGSINDFLSIPTGLLLLPLVVGLYRLHAPHYPLIGGLAALAGAAGFLSTMAGSALLLLGRIDFQQSLIPGMGGFGLIGLWALLNAALSLADGALPRPIALAGVLLGLTPTIILVLLVGPALALDVLVKGIGSVAASRRSAVHGANQRLRLAHACSARQGCFPRGPFARESAGEYRLPLPTATGGALRRRSALTWRECRRRPSGRDR